MLNMAHRQKGRIITLTKIHVTNVCLDSKRNVFKRNGKIPVD